MFCLLTGRWSIDHLLRLKKKLVDPVLALNRSSATHAMHVVSLHWHLLGIDELVDKWLGVGRLRMGHETTVVGALRVVSHDHLLR